MNMSTTQIFIELLITGFGGLIWIVLIVLAAGGLEIDLILAGEHSSIILFPLAGIAYILGILIDRIGYQLFNKPEKKQMQKVFKNEEKLGKVKHMAKFIMLKSERLSGEIDYNRSRLRLCRSWVINFFCISVALLLYIFLNSVTNSKFFIILSISCLILSIISAIVWRKLTRDYYINIASSYNHLKKIKKPV
ncbi:hypothetical protein FGG15_08810 [Flagellimonas algicola]|uniref:Integral membrane protein n=2 Tax=Flagellimonas algicola TaxID=2583815 RepID=A0ABY2WRK4_9FLAO|nr:hypothetical protein FGG15_08810 [Allomuricauda algicola]